MSGMSGRAGQENADRGRLQGSMTALVTPFTAEGKLDEAALERLVAHQQAGGTDVLVPLGTTGEAVTLDEGEKRRVLKIVRKAAEGTPVMAGAGTNDTRTTIENCRMAAGEGADLVLVVGPYYNKPPQEGFRRHFEAVAEASPVPVVLYNVPGRTGSNIEAATQLTLADHPGIVGVKEASGRLDQVAAVLAGRPEGFAVLSGDDDLTLPLLALGADGVVSVAANAVPDLVHDLVAAGLAGRFDQARELHFRLRPLFIAQFTETNPIPIKAATELLGLAGGGVRLPLTPAADWTRQAVRTALANLGRVPPAEV
jgi:4-hydroxy-tetrahydrodipicolinate synthase